MMTIPGQINNEESLLLRLCRLEFNAEQTEQIRSLVMSITDWNYFSTLANSHGVIGLAWHNLEKLNLLPLIPAETGSLLKRALMVSLARNTHNLNTLSEILRLLNIESIRTVLLKGIALELTVYGNCGLRQMTDVDILIDRGKCIKARNILLKNDFISLPVKSLVHKLIIKYIGKHLPSMIRNGTSIDIHHDLFGGKINSLTNLLYHSSYELILQGEKAYIPGPQIFFLYLIKHLWLHERKNESQLRLYSDLVVLLEKHHAEILNNDLLVYAEEAGLSDVLAHRLELIRDFWNMAFPEWIEIFIRKWHNEDTVNQFLFFLKSPKENPDTDHARSYRHSIKEIPGFHNKFLFVLGDFFPSFSFMKKRYKTDSILKILLYYPHRLGKIFWLLQRDRSENSDPL